MFNFLTDNTTMKEPLFNVLVTVDGVVSGRSIAPANYDMAKDNMKKIADDLAYSFEEQGKRILQRCTFGGFSRNASPIPDCYREQYPDAQLLHVQNVQSRKNKISKIVYRLVIA